VSHGQNVTVDVLIGSKCHSGRSELGRNVQAACPIAADKPHISALAAKTVFCDLNKFFLNLKIKYQRFSVSE
jgi:hypothetical protein